MRRWLLLLMVVLLPVRGWAGDWMSVQMATAGVAPRVALAAAAMPSDCPMQLRVAELPGDLTAVPSQENCCSCELCIPMAELASGTAAVAAFASHERPSIAGAGFVSASLAPPVVPPIL